MIVLGILCTIIGIIRVVNAISNSNDEIFKVINSPIEISPDTIKFLLIIVGLIETLCGLFVWFNA